MFFNIVTLFPKLFDAWSDVGVCGRAYHNKLFDLNCWNPRDFSNCPKGSIDDKPYGGGPGMVMMALYFTPSVSNSFASSQIRSNIFLLIAAPGVFG